MSEYSLVSIFLVSLLAILLASELGRHLGTRSAGRGGGNVATLEGAVLGLLALMIGFTFAVALARFEARREAVLNEANAIGTTALRARLLPQPQSTEALKLLSEYVQIRLNVAQRATNGVEFDDAIARSNEIHEALWRSAMMLATQNSDMVPTGLFIQSLNEMIDSQAKRIAAVVGRVPYLVLLALYGAAFIASAFSGYTNGLNGERTRLPIFATGILISAVILLIQDIDRPSSGFIEVSQQPMIDTAGSIKGYIKDAP